MAPRDAARSQFAEDATDSRRGLRVATVGDLGAKAPAAESGRGVQPPSPAVPRRAADVLPFMAGDWKVERQDLGPKLPPDAAPAVGHTAPPPGVQAPIAVFESPAATGSRIVEPSAMLGPLLVSVTV